MEYPQIDVLVCVGNQDINKLFIKSVSTCSKYFPFLSHFYIVTPNKKVVHEKIKGLEIHQKATILSDEEVLDPFLHQEDGWYKQQVIKLEAFKLCKTRFIACLGSDTLLLQTLNYEDLFSPSGLPILYYKKYDYPSPHYDYEKLRLQRVENLLQAKLNRAWSYIDFILDFTVWDSHVLRKLGDYLTHLYGTQKFKTMSPGKCDSLAKKRQFGEWSLYAAFVLDILQADIEVKAFDESYFFQIHSEKDFRRFQFQSKVVHVVDKHLDLQTTLLPERSQCKTSS